jgi:hypothetical protein
MLLPRASDLPFTLLREHHQRLDLVGTRKIHWKLEHVLSCAGSISQLLQVAQDPVPCLLLHRTLHLKAAGMAREVKSVHLRHILVCLVHRRHDTDHNPIHRGNK